MSSGGDETYGTEDMHVCMENKSDRNFSHSIHNLLMKAIHALLIQV